MRRWPKEEILFLENNYLIKTDCELTLHLKRSKQSIRSKRAKLRLLIPKNIATERTITHTPRQKQAGNLNHNWKGGISKNHYHYKKLQVERYPERIKARMRVHYAIKTGKLKKGNCKNCGNSKVEAHHEDYKKPLKIVWLCKKCHNKIHQGE